MKRARVLVAATLSAVLFAGTPAWAGDDGSDARDVISHQVEALRRDDGAAAYGFAAPGIQALFAADTFMGMVQRNYAPVYRHKRFEFGEGSTADGTIKQSVHIVDADGVGWEALYTLERQGDGSVKITGCTLVKADQAV